MTARKPTAAAQRRCTKCHGYLTPPAVDGAWCRCAARRRPGTRWRLLAQGPHGAQYAAATTAAGRGFTFDEVAVDDWLHVEQMDKRHWWMRIAWIRIGVTLPADPRDPPRVLIEADWPVGSPDAPDLRCLLPARHVGKRRTRRRMDRRGGTP